MSKLYAKVRLQVALMLARDIRAYRQGDASRFDRTVNAQGKSILSLDIAKKNIIATCQEVKEQFPVTARMLLNWIEGQ